jgi:hypothetical protein
MGESSEDAANDSGENGIGFCKAHHVGLGTAEDRGGTKGTVGGVPSGQEGGIKTRRENNPLLWWRAFLFDKESLRL